MKKIVDIVMFFACILLSFFLYRQLFHVFFQHGEWIMIGQTRIEGIFTALRNVPVYQLLAGVNRPLGTLWGNVYYVLWPLNIRPFAITAIFLHGTNSFLVMKVGKKIGLTAFFATITGIVFLVSSTPSQAVIWFAATNTTLPGVTFALISLLIFLQSREKGSVRGLVISVLIFYISFLFKESSIVLLPLYVALLFFSSTKNKKIVISLCMFLYIFIVALRLSSLFAGSSSSSYFVTQNTEDKTAIVLRAVLYPIIALPQQYIPFDVIDSFSKNMSSIFYPFLEAHPEKVVITAFLIGDVVSLLLSCLFLLIFLFPGIYNDKKRFVLLIVLGTTLMTYIPYSIAGRLENSYLESRYYYFGMAGGSLLISLLFNIIFSLKKIFRPVIFAVAICFLGMYITVHVAAIGRELWDQKIIAEERKRVILQLQAIGKNLPSKPVVYIAGVNSVPFQQGVGYTLATIWYPTGKIPPSLLRNESLWNEHTEGYVEENGKGFGYFWSPDSLREAEEKYQIRPEQIIGFIYLNDSQRLVPIDPNDMSGEKL